MAKRREAWGGRWRHAWLYGGTGIVVAYAAWLAKWRCELACRLVPCTCVHACMHAYNKRDMHAHMRQTESTACMNDMARSIGGLPLLFGSCTRRIIACRPISGRGAQKANSCTQCNSRFACETLESRLVASYRIFYSHEPSHNISAWCYTPFGTHAASAMSSQQQHMAARRTSSHHATNMNVDARCADAISSSSNDNAPAYTPPMQECQPAWLTPLMA